MLLYVGLVNNATQEYAVKQRTLKQYLQKKKEIFTWGLMLLAIHVISVIRVAETDKGFFFYLLTTIGPVC